MEPNIKKAKYNAPKDPIFKIMGRPAAEDKAFSLLMLRRTIKVRPLEKKAPMNATTQAFIISSVVEVISDIFAERLSSAIDVLGAVHAARSMNRDKHVYSL